MSGECPAPPLAPEGLARTGLVCSETKPSLSDDAIVSINKHLRRTNRLARVIKTAARCLVDSAEGAHKWAMLTLTYAPQHEWQPGQLRGCLDAMRSYLSRRGYSSRYVWVLESTLRGRPHYHVLIQLPRGVTLPKPDKQGWWRYGFTRIEWARSAVSYIAKYASKAGLFNARGSRSYGVSGLSATDRCEVSFWRAPRWARAHCGEERPGLVRVRGGICRSDTGEILSSPFRVSWIGGVMCFVPREVFV